MLGESWGVKCYDSESASLMDVKTYVVVVEVFLFHLFPLLHVLSYSSDLGRLLLWLESKWPGCLFRHETDELKCAQHYSLNVWSSDIELNEPHILKVRQVRFSCIRHESGRKGVGLGGDSLLRVNSRPVVCLLFQIVQEVESVRWREPAARNQPEKIQLTWIQHKTQTHIKNCQTIYPSRMTKCIRSSGYLRFIFLQWNHISQRRVQSKYFVPEWCEPRVDHSVWPGADRFSGHQLETFATCHSPMSPLVSCFFSLDS